MIGKFIYIMRMIYKDYETKYYLEKANRSNRSNLKYQLIPLKSIKAKKGNK